MRVRMKPYQRIGIRLFLPIPVALILCSGVQADITYNMLNDYRLYAYSEYQAKRQYDYTLQIRVIHDQRPQVGIQDQREPWRTTDDTFWMYPVPEMLEQILFREFALSFLFRKVSREDTGSRLILEIVLKSFHGYIERAGLLARLVYGDVAFSAELVQRKPRKTLFTKDYHSRTGLKLRSTTKPRQRMVEQTAKSLEEAVPVLISDIEKVFEGMRPPKRARISPKEKPKPKPRKESKPNPFNVEPVGPK